MLSKNQSLKNVVYKFSCLNSKGNKENFVFEKLQSDRFEEFLDFKINYYVKHEVTHRVAGLHKNPEALQEYRQILSKRLDDPSCHFSMLRSDQTDKIIGFSAVKLFRKEDDYKDVEPAETAELKLFFKILHQWNNLCPPKEVLSKYGVDKMYDDLGIAFHPDYRGIHINRYACVHRDQLCKQHEVPLAGAWLTSSIRAQNSTEKFGWETVFEISYEELGKVCGIKFEDVPPTSKYMVWRACI